jgi:dTDP-4-amino-4,6-dideoxygalactose transaminase
VATALTAEGVPAKQLFPPWQTTPAYAGHPQISDGPTPHAALAAATVVALPHRLLQDFTVADDVIAALAKLTNHPDTLLAWQKEQAAADRHSPTAPR